MRRVVALLALVVSTLAAQGQEVVPFRYGSVDYAAVLQRLPAYDEAMATCALLAEEYATELRADEEEFQQRYDDFLTHASSYAPAILRKRQSELEEMLIRNEEFRSESNRQLQELKDSLLTPIYCCIDSVIADVATTYTLAFVLNTSASTPPQERTVPYVNSTMSIDITAEVLARITKDIVAPRERE